MYLACRDKILKREKPLWKIGGREKTCDISSYENETEQIFDVEGDCVTFHYVERTFSERLLNNTTI